MKNKELGVVRGRIHCLVPKSQFPQFFRFTAGRGSVYARINCNDYVGCLVREHNFNYNGRGQNVSRILETVPEIYRNIFKEGYGGNLDINPIYKKAKKETNIRSSHTHSLKSLSPAAAPTMEKIKISQPIQVTIGEKVIHKTFGLGIIYEDAGKYVRIRFDSVGDKTFGNPDAFEKGFITKV